MLHNEKEREHYQPKKALASNHFIQVGSTTNLKRIATQNVSRTLVCGRFRIQNISNGGTMPPKSSSGYLPILDAGSLSLPGVLLTKTFPHLLPRSKCYTTFSRILALNKEVLPERYLRSCINCSYLILN